MLNLLFISDSPKTEHIKSVLQPELKVIIDVVSDFDHGLKDVFEKRPATVCIQDQIGGVTGESVARHIQMLLGSSAPTFILLHSGNGKARAINGLFEHLIDLNQANETVSGEIKSTLKALLGDDWEKIYIPPKLPPASIRSSVAVPEESREDADRLVDDFISDLETSGFLVADEQPPALSPPDGMSHNELVPRGGEPSPVSGKSAVTAVPDRSQERSDDAVDRLLEQTLTSGENAQTSGLGDGSARHADISGLPKSEPAATKAFSDAPKSRAVSGKAAPDKPVVPAPPKKKSKAVSTPEIEPPPTPPPVVPAAAEFRISQNVAPDDEHVPEDLLQAFEENYRSESPFVRRGVVVALVLLVCTAGGWFLVTQQPRLMVSLKERLMPVSGTKETPPVPPPPPPAPKPVAAVVPLPVPPPVPVPSLPAFVPKDGRDASYASKNPGWERYVGKNAEFRLFSASGRIQALQILALKGAPLSDSYIQSVLQEFAGDSRYQITSSSVKSGVRVENGKVKDKAEVKIYRKDGVVKAFVVSVN